MIIKLDIDLLLPIAVVILAITITIVSQLFTLKSNVDQLVYENDALFMEVSQANHEISTLTHQLDSYHATEEALISLGASHTQAVAVIKAAETFSLDPKF